MGAMRFLVPRRERIAQSAIERAYISGLDEIPWQSRTQWTDEGLIVRRSENDSGNFHMPWPVVGHGELMLSTACLMEREKPYLLQVELARGTIHRIRNQIAVWQGQGMVLPPGAIAYLAVARGYFSRAVTMQHTPEAAADHAERALTAALGAESSLAASYIEQALAIRRRQGAKLTTLWGVNLGSSLLKENVMKEIAATFTTATVPFGWREVAAREGKYDWTLSDRQVEWCRSRNLKICGGPLVQLDAGSMPDWLYLWEEDEENLRTFVAEYLTEVVTRYRGKVNLWKCAGRLNCGNVLSLSEEQRLRLAVLAVETVRAADPRSPIVIMIDQPWAEFMSQRECDLSPLHFADALVRSDLGLAGIGLEINLGYSPGGTAPRDLLDFSRQLDRWSSLGLPLLVSLTAPSEQVPDPHARSSAAAVSHAAEGPVCPQSQRQWIEHFVPLLLAKQPVQAITWNQLLDSQPHDYPWGGLFDLTDQPKPALEALKTLRQNHFN
jgi:Glycosyl hydrolase family 10